MPELPEVEVLCRHLRAVLVGRRIRQVQVLRRKVLGRTSPSALSEALVGATFCGISRRGKYLLFDLRSPRRKRIRLIGHLGMTGRMFVQETSKALPRHAAVALLLNQGRFVYEDARYFGRLSLDDDCLLRLGPEPLAPEFSSLSLAEGLSRSRQPIKVKLLDQSLLAGIGNIYASEALFLARIHPARPSNSLTSRQIGRLATAIRSVLARAISLGSTVPLTFEARNGSDLLFYFGSRAGASRREEMLNVYDREGEPCRRCRRSIVRIRQAGRSTFFCPGCQPRGLP